jgi:ferredoxin
MQIMKNHYAQNRFLRRIEAVYSSAERLLNRFTTLDFNPFYHLGTLSIFLLLVLIVTGSYLALFYRPGSAVAFQTTQALSANPFGMWVRTLHRYATDAFMLVVLLHFVKMLVTSRFWGTRWLAWVSGWVMVVLTWLIGVLGYWLVWDARGQWLNEWLFRLSSDPSSLPFFSPNQAVATYPTFFLILLMHILLPLIVFLGVFIHVFRLARARWWAPRWLMLETGILLALMAVVKPAITTVPADFSKTISTVPLNIFYLGFLPLAENWGVLWLVLLLGGGILALLALPWLAPNRQHSAAEVVTTACTGCVLCANECPYDAIRMVAREDASGYRKLAVINSEQCTACGVCLGACPADAIQLQGTTPSIVLRGLQQQIAPALQSGKSVTVVYAEQRAVALGGLPTPLKNFSAGQSVFSIDWSPTVVVVACILPSASTVNLEWVKALQQQGVREQVILTSPYDDGVHREDAHWVLERMRLRRLHMPDLHWVMAGANDPAPLNDLLERLQSGVRPAHASMENLPVLKKRGQLLKPAWLAAIAGSMALLFIFSVGWFSDVPVKRATAGEAAVRLVLPLQAKVSGVELPANYTPPPGADVSTIFATTYYPLDLRLVIDGQVMWQKHWQLQKTGNGRVAVIEYLPVNSGAYQIQVWLKDDEQAERLIFDQSANIQAGQVLQVP